MNVYHQLWIVLPSFLKNNSVILAQLLPSSQITVISLKSVHEDPLKFMTGFAQMSKPGLCYLKLRLSLGKLIYFETGRMIEMKLAFLRGDFRAEIITG